MSEKEDITFEQVLGSLLDLDTPFPPSFLYRFSDLASDELEKFQRTWSDVPAWRRIAIMEDVEELGETNYTLSFEAIARYCLKDKDPGVRAIAVRTLWEYDLPDIVPNLLTMVVGDENPDVRAVSASALGKYVYLGELEKLPQKSLKAIEELLIKVINGSDTTLVRRRALESLGYSSSKEVSPMIERAYYSGKDDMVVSALFAMGRSANPIWRDLVIDLLDSDNPQIRTEAARAAGELEISRALPDLFTLLDDSDDEVRLASIWSLSQIGGEGVQEALEDLYEETSDDEEARLIETALDNLAFTNDMQLFTMLDMDEDVFDRDLDSDFFELHEGNEDFLN
jgi:HEAT repeat protein